MMRLYRVGTQNPTEIQELLRKMWEYQSTNLDSNDYNYAKCYWIQKNKNGDIQLTNQYNPDSDAISFRFPLPLEWTIFDHKLKAKFHVISGWTNQGLIHGQLTLNNTYPFYAFVAARITIFEPYTMANWVEHAYNRDICYNLEMSPPVVFNKSSIHNDVFIIFNKKTKRKRIFGTHIRIMAGMKPTATVKDVNDWRKKSNQLSKIIHGEHAVAYQNIQKKERNDIMNASKFLKQILIDYKDGKTVELFSQEYNVDISDMDQNGHLNQSYYVKFFENTLNEYDMEYFNNKWYIHDCFVNYIKEIKLKYENNKNIRNKCKAIILDCQENERRYIGLIKNNNNEVCCLIMCYMKLYKSNQSKL